MVWRPVESIVENEYENHTFQAEEPLQKENPKLI